MDNQTQQNQIIVDGKLDSNITKVLSQVCLNLQKQYDMSPVLINKLINAPNFLETCTKCNEHFGEILNKHLKKIAELARSEEAKETEKKSADINESILSNPGKNGWEGEQCGFLIKTYPNGYKKYCNQHKYLHSRNDKNLNHQFVFKTDRQISEERTFQAKFDYYQEYLNKLLESFQDIVNGEIKRDYSVIRIKVMDILILNEWLKSHTDCFKTKFILNLVQTDQKGLDYGGYIDVFIPNERLEEYLEQVQNIMPNFTIVSKL